MIEHELVLILRHGASEIAAGSAHGGIRRVLIHDRNGDVANRVPDEIEHTARILGMPRQHEMAHDDSAHPGAICASGSSPMALKLPRHLNERALGD